MSAATQPNPPFTYRDDQLWVEQVPIASLVQTYGTPLYVYSRSALASAYREFADAAPGRELQICYAMKANSTLGVLDCLAQEGAGFDIVSGGELKRALAVGANPELIVFSGVGKSSVEIREALLSGVGCFNVESEPELNRLNEIALGLGLEAPVSLRVNPDVDAGTHPYISTGLRDNKFGIAHEQALATYQLAASLPGLKVVGIDCHIGSQITEISPFLAALDRVLDLYLAISESGIALDHIDLGGGLGVAYERTDQPPSRGDLIRQIFERLDQRLGSDAGSVKLMFEFGRSIAGPAGMLISKVEYLKPTAARNFAIIDAAMNDLLRPSLYQAVHPVFPVHQSGERENAQYQTWDLVGPVCESGDWLAKGCDLSLAPADLLAFGQAGAYGAVMSSNYNSRGRAAEVLVDGATVHLIREREHFDTLIAGEHKLPIK